MAVTIRPAAAADAAACGVILYRAFQTLAESHNFPPGFPSVEVATGLLTMLLANPGFYGVVAEDGGRVVGSNFADQRSPICRHRSNLGGSDGAKPGRWLQPDTGADRPLRRAEFSEHQAGPSGLPQPFALPLYQARVPHARTAIGDAGPGAERQISGIRGETGDRGRHRRMQSAVPPCAWLRSRQPAGAYLPSILY